MGWYCEFRQFLSMVYFWWVDVGVFVFVGGYGWVGMCCYCALNLYMSNYTNLGDGIILGLRIDKEGQGQGKNNH